MENPEKQDKKHLFSKIYEKLHENPDRLWDFKTISKLEFISQYGIISFIYTFFEILSTTGISSITIEDICRLNISSESIDKNGFINLNNLRKL